MDAWAGWLQRRLLAAPKWGCPTTDVAAYGQCNVHWEDGMGNLSALIGASSVGVTFAPLFAGAAIALGCWVLYAIIWRAVRRGLREYHEEVRPLSPVEYPEMERRL
jgi:hypothetical protein